ncbi:MAG: malto-oligosyltrehalose trehalohydrolase, partial [Rubrobacter sp.]|nr:malto-oligosyltrehalose trehalohydrolase [Rubrobacter sp.]
MIRRHRLPFGAEYLGDGRTRFTVWAPAAESMDLVLDDRIEPMERGEGGAFALTTEAAPGDRYQYRVDGGQEFPDPASRHQPEDVHGPSV